MGPSREALSAGPVLLHLSQLINESQPCDLSWAIDMNYSLNAAGCTFGTGMASEGLLYVVCFGRLTKTHYQYIVVCAWLLPPFWQLSSFILAVTFL